MAILKCECECKIFVISKNVDVDTLVNSDGEYIFFDDYKEQIGKLEDNVIKCSGCGKEVKLIEEEKSLNQAIQDKDEKTTKEIEKKVENGKIVRIM